jgi:hypothetical protein
MKDSFIQAVSIHILAIAKITGEAVCVHCLGREIKALPSDSLEDVMVRAGAAPNVSVLPVEQGKIELSGGKQWIGKPDPQYKGETKRIIPFDDFEEG